MARYLKQSTTTNIKMGPFLDDTDGKTAETALTPTVKVSKAGGTMAARNSATATAHDADGYYTVELNATDTATLGRLRATATASGALPVWEDFVVLHANVYDVIFGSVAPSTHTAAAVQALVAAGAVASVTNPVTVTGTPAVNVAQWSGSAVATPSVAGVPEVDITHANGTTVTMGAGVELAASQPNYAPATVAALAAVSTTIGAAGAGLTALAPAATALSTAVWTPTKAGYLDTAISGVDDAVMTALEAGGDAVAVVAAAVRDVAIAGAAANSLGSTLAARASQTSVDTIDDLLDTEVAAIKTDTAAILADTAELQSDWANGGRLDLILDAAAVKTGMKLASDGLDAVVVETGINARQSLSLIGAATVGKAAGLDTATATFYAMGVSGTSTARIVATTTADGNRSATTLTVPA